MNFNPCLLIYNALFIFITIHASSKHVYLAQITEENDTGQLSRPCAGDYYEENAPEAQENEPCFGDDYDEVSTSECDDKSGKGQCDEFPEDSEGKITRLERMSPPGEEDAAQNNEGEGEDISRFKRIRKHVSLHKNRKGHRFNSVLQDRAEDPLSNSDAGEEEDMRKSEYIRRFNRKKGKGRKPYRGHRNSREIQDVLGNEE